MRCCWRWCIFYCSFVNNMHILFIVCTIYAQIFMNSHFLREYIHFSIDKRPSAVYNTEQTLKRSEGKP